MVLTSLEDRFTRGFIAGIIGDVAMNLWNYIAYHVLNLTTMRLLDYASVMLVGKKVFMLWEEIFFQLAQIFFSAAVGIFFSYLTEIINSKYYLLKSWFYSVGIWFFVFATGSLFKMPYIYKVPTQTAFANFIGSSIYGLVLGLTLHWLDNRVKASPSK